MPIQLDAPAAPASASERPRLSWDLNLGGARALNAKERMFLTERLGLLLETGIPLHPSLELLERQASGPRVRAVLGRLRDDVAAGLSFSQALERHPQSFPASYVHLVAAGEQGGFLHEVLDKLRQMDERRQDLHSTLLMALAYPAFLALFSVAVVVFILVVVFPKFGPLFESIHDHLPVTTKLLMAASVLLVDYWIPLALGLTALGFLLWRLTRNPDTAEKLDRAVLQLPLLRDVVVEIYLVQFLHVISLSLTHGVAMLDALKACREIAGSASFQRFVSSLERTVSEGGRVASGFEASPFIPPLVKQMIATGEESGSLGPVTGRVADFFEREWKRRLALLSKLAEPAMLIFMGAVVGTVVSSLILPIFQLSRAVR